MIPNKEIEKILFEPTIDTKEFIELMGELEFVNYGDFKEVNWLNTPGPVYTTYTDNCGTGQVEAMNNVGGDEDYHEVIFKQPFDKRELVETLTAAAVDPFGAYYFDGNQNWTTSLIIEWWQKSNERVNYILDRYHDELNLPAILYRPLYGPRKPIPENYKNWLEFYRKGMKEYLEWYILKLSNQGIILNTFSFDWTRKNKLDAVLESKKRG
jgi:hypothetical protein